MQKKFVKKLEKILEDARRKGAEPQTYGEEHEKGFFFNPTIIPAASTDMEVCNIEIFGPVAPVITAKDEDEAVEIANSTEFGLGAKIWSGDPYRTILILIYVPIMWQNNTTICSIA
ncbi:Succinate-semialdehyde dehydrogenase [NAD] [Methanosarcina siciliae C2J]|uniref:Succinate-semialdehyde dehydrogenase [NAD] n=1 Tax=Methanosarcina siciliae C2J TaxID=1434118 RepID=A0A0E3LCB7_9EURY|nr:Succinate-semialdehyde dehydrogenase [NAD] [Methanosarcina siciliae C2J]